MKWAFPGICGLVGGGALSIALIIALSGEPKAGNLWLALFASILMIFGAGVALLSARRERGREVDSSEGSTIS